MITQIAIINKLEDDLVLLGDADHSFEVEICKLGLDNVRDETWERGAKISRAIIFTRMELRKQKRLAGGY